MIFLSDIFLQFVFNGFLMRIQINIGKEVFKTGTNRKSNQYDMNMIK